MLCTDSEKRPYCAAFFFPPLRSLPTKLGFLETFDPLLPPLDANALSSLK
jgi:hypothetical protein